ncbi:MAG: hypothetical protein NW207_05535 [Cytophagales bacterium]|nr:hypothetical protein [Cytophagales bacterium]
MKKIVKYLAIIPLLVLLFACGEKTPAPSTITTSAGSNMPEKFKVDIPNSVSYSTSSKVGARLEANASGKIDGGESIYDPLRAYIMIGEQAAKTVEEIIIAIRKNGLNQPLSFEFPSDEDKRTKVITVVENVVFEGTTYSFGLTCKDKAADKVAMQVFWNSKPIKGTAMLNLYALEMTDKNKAADKTTFRVDYSEADPSYDQTMLVQIAGIDNSTDKQAPINLKMFAGKKGDIVSVYGNSHHENVTGLGAGAINYAFRAKGNVKDDLGVAEVSIPPSSLTGTTGMMDTYSVKNILINLIKKQYNLTDVPNTLIGTYLTNFDAPGYFKSDKFVGAGNYPSSITGFADIKDLSALTPYIPSDIAALKLEFKK